MRIVHIGYQYGEENTGGAAIAATRLHKALQANGVESYYVCVRQSQEGINVSRLPVGWKRLLYLTLTKALRCLWRFTPYNESIELNCVPMYGLENLLKRINPDIVHVHWLNADVASFE